MNKQLTKIPEIIVSEILTSFLTPDGREINNPTPLVCHTGLNKPLTLDERVEKMLSIKLSQHNKRLGGESIEEATDFEVDDDFETEPVSDCEFTEMQEEFFNQKPEGEPVDPPDNNGSIVEPEKTTSEGQLVSPTPEPEIKPVQTPFKIQDGKLQP